MISVSKIARTFLLPFFLVTGVLLGASYAARPDTTTAGGFIINNGANANFGLNARNPAAPSGHVNFVDHASGLHFRSTDITAYIIVDADTRQIEGTGVLDDGTTVTFVVVVTDAGEPGTSDTFSITLSNGFSASGTLVGGNVQIHPAN